MDSIELEKLNRNCGDILNRVVKSIDKRIFQITPAYNLSSIGITARDGKYGDRIWIRLVRTESNNVIFVISSVEFETVHRGKGYLYKLACNVAKLDCVEGISVENVITPEMHRWCVRAGMKIIENREFTAAASYYLSSKEWIKINKTKL